jgi:hypothetical protein
MQKRNYLRFCLVGWIVITCFGAAAIGHSGDRKRSSSVSPE